jgi:hypothetical protein
MHSYTVLASLIAPPVADSIKSNSAPFFLNFVQIIRLLQRFTMTTRYRVECTPCISLRREPFAE